MSSQEEYSNFYMQPGSLPGETMYFLYLSRGVVIVQEASQGSLISLEYFPYPVGSSALKSKLDGTASAPNKKAFILQPENWEQSS